MRCGLIIIIGIWMGLGLTYIFLLSAVRSVSEELLEAATAEIGARHAGRRCAISIPP